MADEAKSNFSLKAVLASCALAGCAATPPAEEKPAPPPAPTPVTCSAPTAGSATKAFAAGLLGGAIGGKGGAEFLSKLVDHQQRDCPVSAATPASAASSPLPPAK